MTPALLEKYLCTVPKDSILVWSGFSEPFLNPHFPEIIRKYNADGWKMRLDTTLANCSIETARLVKEIPWTYLKLHLSSFGDLMKLPVTPEYLEVLKIVSTNPCHKCFVYFGILSKEIKAIVDAAEPKDFFTTLHSRANNVAVMPTVERHKGTLKRCLWLERGHLLPNGKLTLCCESWKLEHILGDLNHERYEDVFKKPEYLELLAAHEDESKPLLCRTCTSGYYSE